GAARPRGCQELRRFVDRVRVAGRRPRGARRRARSGVKGEPVSVNSVTGCGEPEQGAPIPASVDIDKETGITDYVRTDVGEPIPGAYVRLLDATGEFTAEVVTSSAGQFRFFAAPGTWKLRALSRVGNGDAEITADRGINELSVQVAP